jgi:hypothetical protein
MTNARLQRRVSITVRRDAAQQLTNGRILYDALFTRTGYQTYPRADGSVSVEYRPPSEVFRADSLASLCNLPGVLLHPSQNFGTKFDGQYDVKGCTGSNVVEHTDHIHTAGTLCVWDDDWNAGIERGDIGDLSAGYGINPGPGGVGPDGTRYDVLHTDIIGDHMAGVPAGNAGTARVVTDARAVAAVLASRQALADIAACRMDARPLYFQMGQWPHRESPRMDDIEQTPDFKEYVKRDALAAAAPKLTALGATATAKQVLDVWIDVCGLSDDPAMLKVCAALGSMEATGTSSGAPMMDAAQLEQQRLDVAELASERADVLEAARFILGRDYAHRVPVLDAEHKPVMDAAGQPKTAPKTLDAIKREIVTKIDAARIPKIDAFTDPAKREVALDIHLAECRAIADARASRAPVDALLEEINTARKDNARGGAPALTPEQIEMADRVASASDPSKQVLFGRTQPQAPQTPAR